MLEEFTSIGQKLGHKLLSEHAMLATVESCTGGWVSAALTSVPGSSSWFERGFVTYSNESKQEMVKVPEKILSKYGAVSGETAQAMAEGAIKHSNAKVALAISGLAGPRGATKDKPIGTVWFAWCSDGLFETQVECKQLMGTRNEIRSQCVKYSIEHLLYML